VNKKRNCNQPRSSAQAHPSHKIVRASILPMTRPSKTPNMAQNMAQLADVCVQCGLCLPHCPTYELDRSEAESPRGRIAYMKALATGLLAPSDSGDAHLDHCLGCRRCEAACPANVEYGDLLALARAQQFLRELPPYKTKVLSNLLTKPALLDIAGSLARWTGRLPVLPKNNTPLLVPTGDTDKKVAIFVGCIAKTYETSTRLSLQRLLNAIGFSVEPVNDQTCCGTAALHLGDSETANVLVEKNRSAFADNITVLTLATGCHEQLSRSLQGQNKVVDALDFILQHSSNLKFKAVNKQIALHIPCSQSTVVKSDSATRTLLGMISQLDVYELADRSCCGAAGLHMLTDPQRADRLRAPLTEDIREACVTELLSANIGCRLHIANELKIPVRHPIDFLAEHLA
jgi:glycolate oxidase iron-sulfur subunit